MNHAQIIINLMLTVGLITGSGLILVLVYSTIKAMSTSYTADLELTNAERLANIKKRMAKIDSMFKGL